VAVVAFVGLGRMGRLMTAKLVVAGHEVRGSAIAITTGGAEL
jgi:3-hydroxyisobutyrate dehydrogenase-like beta-hydroxyacid dehydrogenase